MSQRRDRKKISVAPGQAGYRAPPIPKSKYPMLRITRVEAGQTLRVVSLSDVCLLAATHFNPWTKETIPCTMDYTGECPWHAKFRLDFGGFIVIKERPAAERRILHLPKLAVAGCDALAQQAVIFDREITAYRERLGRTKRVKCEVAAARSGLYDEAKMVSHNWLWECLLNIWGFEFTSEPGRRDDVKPEAKG